jgi:hypothetical protein
MWLPFGVKGQCQVNASYGAYVAMHNECAAPQQKKPDSFGNDAVCENA